MYMVFSRKNEGLTMGPLAKPLLPWTGQGLNPFKPGLLAQDQKR
jgi:hypothetical protein